MSITKTLLAGVAGTVLLSAGAMAAEPLKLTDAQLDDVTAGNVSSFAFFSDTIPVGFGLFAFEGVAVAEAKDSADIPPTPPQGLAFKQEGFAFASLSAGFGPATSGGFSLGGIAAPGVPAAGGGLFSTLASSTNAQF